MPVTGLADRRAILVELLPLHAVGESLHFPLVVKVRRRRSSQLTSPSESERVLSLCVPSTTIWTVQRVAADPPPKRQRLNSGDQTNGPPNGHSDHPSLALMMLALSANKPNGHRFRVVVHSGWSITSRTSTAANQRRSRMTENVRPTQRLAGGLKIDSPVPLAGCAG